MRSAIAAVSQAYITAAMLQNGWRFRLILTILLSPPQPDIIIPQHNRRQAATIGTTLTASPPRGDANKAPLCKGGSAGGGGGLFRYKSIFTIPPSLASSCHLPLHKGGYPVVINYKNKTQKERQCRSFSDSLPQEKAFDQITSFGISFASAAFL